MRNKEQKNKRTKEKRKKERISTTNGRMMTLSLSMLNEQDKFDNIIRKLAAVHNERGVKAVEYGIMGEVLIWSLKQVLGPNVFTPACKSAWVRIFCRMIKVMIPLAVHYEMENGEAQKARLANIDQNEIDEPVTKFKDHSSAVSRDYGAWADSRQSDSFLTMPSS